MGIFDDIYYDPVTGMFREDLYNAAFTASRGFTNTVREIVESRLQNELQRQMTVWWKIQQEKALYGDHAWPMYGFHNPADKSYYDMSGGRAIGPLRVIVTSAIPEGEFWLMDRDGNNIVRHSFRDGFDAEEYNAALEEGAFDD